MVREKQYKRISLIYLDNVCCVPVRDALVAAMKNLKLELASIHSHTVAQMGAGIDFDQFAADVWKHRPQGVFMMAVPGFNNPFLEAMHKIATYPVTYATGSWTGDAHKATFLNSPHLAPSVQ